MDNISSASYKSSNQKTNQKTKWYDFVPKSIICCFKEKYTFSTLKKDLIAGITVGIVSLPLALAFAIASGVTPEKGLYTAIVGGFLISLLGGSRVLVGGPTGAFVVVIYGIMQRHGYEGLLIATLIAAVLLVAMGLLRLGTLIKYIPYPLITGFTAGIGVIIFTAQIKDFFGLHTGVLPPEFLMKWKVFFQTASSWEPTTCAVASATLLLIIAIRKYVRVIPWGIASIVVATAVCWMFGLSVETVADRFGEIPRTLPAPGLSYELLSLDKVYMLIPDGITIALLAGIESLLCAVIADGMIGSRHRSNCELIGQGIANLGSIFFGGIPATGAIARTAVNVEAGARTPIAGMTHAVVLLLLSFSCAPFVGKIPFAALSAILMMIAWNMSEFKHIRQLFKAPLSDIAVLLTAFSLTILVDITVAVIGGMILAVFLFMRRMSHHSSLVSLKTFEGIEVYEITGPLFFGVVDRLKDALHHTKSLPQTFILQMRHVPLIDASAMHALKELHLKCQQKGMTLALSDVQELPAKSLRKYGLEGLMIKEP
jgi:SulP family sulfate permease